MTTELTPADLTPSTSSRLGRRRQATRVVFKRVNVVRDILPLAALLALVVYFSVRAEAFLSAANLTLISGQAGILLLASLGATLVIIAGSVDLSVGSIALLTGAVLASLINAGIGSPVVVLLIAVAVGAAIGLLNGVVFAYGRVPSFIATLGTLSLFAGIGLTILQGSTINFTDQGIRDLAIGQLIPNVQNAALIAIVAFLVVWFFARRTRFGLYVYAVGGNERVVELAGVSTRRVKVLILVVSGITAGLAGLLLTAQLGAAGPTHGLDDPARLGRRDRHRRHRTVGRRGRCRPHGARCADPDGSVQRAQPDRRGRLHPDHHQGPGDHRRGGLHHGLAAQAHREMTTGSRHLSAADCVRL